MSLPGRPRKNNLKIVKSSTCGVKQIESADGRLQNGSARSALRMFLFVYIVRPSGHRGISANGVRLSLSFLR